LIINLVYTNAMEKIFLVLKSWAGLSNKPFSRKMTINNDGSYMISMKYALPKDQADNHESSGTIEPDRLSKIREFAQNYIKSPYSMMMHDAGYTLEYYSDEKVIKMENNLDLWRQVIALIPEF
jgi:hypothetical protein